jgi:hypothetical protein
MATMSGFGEVNRCPAAPVKPRGTWSAIEGHRRPQAAKRLLESEGVATLLRPRLPQSVHPFTIGAQGDIAILVVQRGRILLTGTLPGAS